MDYAEEQAMEVDALRAILMDEFEGASFFYCSRRSTADLLSHPLSHPLRHPHNTHTQTELQGPRPAGWPDDVACYRVLITPTTEGGEAASSDESEWRVSFFSIPPAYSIHPFHALTHAPLPTHSPLSLSFTEQLDLVFAYPPTYPDAAPLLKPRSVRGLSAAELAEVAAACDAAVEANGGMPMMYAVISAAQDWLRGVVGRGLGAGVEGSGGGGAEEVDEEAAAAAAKAAAAEAEEARLAAARALGTPVTPASFAAWRARFDAEMAALRAEKGGGGDAASGAGAATTTSRSGTGAGAGPTGRAYFQALDAGAAAAEGGDGDGGGDEFPEEPEEEEVEEEDVGFLDDESDNDDEGLDELEEALAGAAVE
jgi:hypothetical protein